MGSPEASQQLDAMLSRVGGPELVQWHKRNNAQTNEVSYLTSYRRVLVKGIKTTTVIYLDTNFWIRLRDAEIQGSRADPNIRGLLARLKTLTQGRQTVCVGHSSSFLELVKQAPDSLRVTAKLFDELSEGIVVAPPEDRRYWEAGDFVLHQLGLREQAALGYWSKIGQVLSSRLPEAFWRIPDGIRQAVGKSVLDALWNARLEDILAQFDWDPRRRLDSDIDPETIAQVEARKAEQLAARKARHVVRAETFAEHIGTYYRPLFIRHLEKCNAIEGYRWAAPAIRDRCNGLIEAANQSFRANRLGLYLPMAALQTELYTLYEIDAGRRLTTNDWADWQHAMAALPLCDIFLTEAHLAHQLTHVLHADATFACAVASDVPTAHAALDNL